MKKKPLFIIYTTDLGGLSLGNSYKSVLSDECEFFEFNEYYLKKSFRNIMFYFKYFKLIFQLRFVVKKSLGGNQKVIFQNVKPAFFCYGIWDKTNCVIISDFSHTLFQWFKKNTFNKNIRYYFQKFLLKRVYRHICLTKNLLKNLNEVYGISKEKIKHVPLPIDFDYYQKPKKTTSLPTVLFVGGDFYRKGGHHITNNWKSKLKDKCKLILLTKQDIQVEEGVKIYNDLSKGDKLHKFFFSSADIFILPTYRDAYPIVLGEAAAAGLAIITTKYALGANEIIINNCSGYIAESPEQCIDLLLRLLDNKDLIDSFKNETNKLILKNFSKKNFKKLFFESIK